MMMMSERRQGVERRNKTIEVTNIYYIYEAGIGTCKVLPEYTRVDLISSTLSRTWSARLRQEDVRARKIRRRVEFSILSCAFKNLKMSHPEFSPRVYVGIKFWNNFAELKVVVVFRRTAVESIE